MSQIHSCGKEKKEIPVDSTILADWGRAVSFPSRSLRKGSYKILTILLPLTFSQSGIHRAQPSRTEQPWTRTKSLFLRCTWHFLSPKLKGRFYLQFHQQAPRTQRGWAEENKNEWKFCWVPESISNSGFKCRKCPVGQICYCLRPHGVRDTNICPSAKWMRNAAKSDAKEHFEPSGFGVEW